MRPSRLALALAFALPSFSLACSSSKPGATGGSGGAAGGAGGQGTPVVIGGSRPVTVHVPPGYDAAVPTPLLVMLHGYSASGFVEELYLGLTAQSDAKGFLYIYPDGTEDASGNRFWNATDACCNFNGSTVDDSAYVSGLIKDVQAQFNVDPKRVFLFGHSNGAFMSYRLACDHADQVAAIVSLAGAMWEDVSKCKPSEPVAILEVHGTADKEVLYGGSQIHGDVYPSARTTVLDWVTLDGCAPTADTSAPSLDLDGTLPGAETAVARYGAGCKAGGHAELWSIQGGSHLPAFDASFDTDAVGFLYAHPKP